MSCSVQCVKIPIRLSFLWYLQITSKYLCVLVVLNGVKQRAYKNRCIMKGKQMSKHMKSLSGIKQNDSGRKRIIEQIDDSFCPMCENACIHLVTRYLQVVSKYLLVLAELSGLEWGWAVTS